MEAGLQDIHHEPQREPLPNAGHAEFSITVAPAAAAVWW